MEGFSKLTHLLMMGFLYTFATTMVIPAITDVTMSALCPGRDECSVAIYFTGFQQVVTGLGAFIMMPLLGNLSDRLGRKTLLTIPMILTILPLGILGYGRSRHLFYVYFVLKCVTSTVCEGSVQCLAIAYAADNVPAHQRASAFGLLSAVGSSAFVCGTLCARFLSISSTFQVAASVAAAAVVYMRLFLTDSIADCNLSAPLVSGENVESVSLDPVSPRKEKVITAFPSVKDLFALLKTSTTKQAAIVAFFGNLADVGLHASILYYLKARFHFNKDKFADLLMISGAASTFSQLLLMPILVPALGEETLLSVGLFFNCVHMLLHSIALADWVAYVATMFSVLFVFWQPCLRSIVSKQFGASEQGMAQGCISGISSFANVVSPLVFSPLTALFLSENAPFNFPGFSIMCAGSSAMIAFVQSSMIRAPTKASISIIHVEV
ncbi:hippocampus abundant transcript 1 protein isoform X2 [Cucurbita pepo subsp. pepo]|uniref:hippocampus abundant transcript 1 protein isoform X2 n=1 Tax=Cucurbita pepo subsp. pepo TaxID=3664 RepID=UPI000C9D9CCD|nr:hippocampus abundant transcript 1 protein isoform X2 [Cucurbita pepo subsp. pepo]